MIKFILIFSLYITNTLLLNQTVLAQKTDSSNQPKFEVGQSLFCLSGWSIIDCNVEKITSHYNSFTYWASDGRGYQTNSRVLDTIITKEELIKIQTDGHISEGDRVFYEAGYSLKPKKILSIVMFGRFPLYEIEENRFSMRSDIITQDEYQAVLDDGNIKVGDTVVFRYGYSLYSPTVLKIYKTKEEYYYDLGKWGILAKKDFVYEDEFLRVDTDGKLSSGDTVGFDYGGRVYRLKIEKIVKFGSEFLYQFSDFGLGRDQGYFNKGHIKP